MRRITCIHVARRLGKIRKLDGEVTLRRLAVFIVSFSSFSLPLHVRSN